MYIIYKKNAFPFIAGGSMSQSWAQLLHKELRSDAHVSHVNAFFWSLQFRFQASNSLVRFHLQLLHCVEQDLILVTQVIYIRVQDPDLHLKQRQRQLSSCIQDEDSFIPSSDIRFKAKITLQSFFLLKVKRKWSWYLLSNISASDPYQTGSDWCAARVH